jgi:hypothetical protein
MPSFVPGPDREEPQRRAGWLVLRLHQSIQHLVERAVSAYGDYCFPALFHRLTGQQCGMTGSGCGDKVKIETVATQAIGNRLRQTGTSPPTGRRIHNDCRTRHIVPFEQISN